MGEVVLCSSGCENSAAYGCGVCIEFASARVEAGCIDISKGMSLGSLGVLVSDVVGWATGAIAVEVLCWGCTHMIVFEISKVASGLYCCLVVLEPVFSELTIIENHGCAVDGSCCDSWAV